MECEGRHWKFRVDADVWSSTAPLNRFLDRETVTSAWSPFMHCLVYSTWDRFLKTDC